MDEVICLTRWQMKNRVWKTFSLGDKKYFTLHSTLNGIDKNKLVDSGEKKYPYITRSKNNNGLDMFVSEQPQEINKGNVIIIGLDTQTVFYQESDFYTGQNVQILYNKHLTKNIAFFLIPIIKKQLAVLNWGGNGATLGRLKKKNIILPVKDDGTPDWSFIEEYIRIKSNQINHTYKLPEIHEISDKRELSEVEWDRFVLGEIFTDIKSGKSKGLSHLKSGKTAYLGATNRNNGVLDFVEQNEKMIQKGNAIAFIRNGEGSIGYSIYKKEDFIATSDISVGRHPKLNIYTGTFITTVADKVRGKYSFGYKRSDTRLKKETLLLPSKSGQPDFDFMEQYMKRIENKVISKIGKL